MYFMPTPSICDECGAPFGTAVGTTMIDGPSQRTTSRTFRGPGTPWGCFCFYCWEKIKTTDRFGTGIAQKYIRDETGYFKRVPSQYRVFTRTWWTYGEDGNLEPNVGPETQLCIVNTEEEAKARCRAWNAANVAGPLDRRAEYSEVV